MRTSQQWREALDNWCPDCDGGKIADDIIDDMEVLESQIASLKAVLRFRLDPLTYQSIVGGDE